MKLINMQDYSENEKKTQIFKIPQIRASSSGKRTYSLFLIVFYAQQPPRKCKSR